ncbi:MAG: hypothetical protein R3A80_05385 [Bdellovibrionota bacterium]
MSLRHAYLLFIAASLLILVCYLPALSASPWGVDDASLVFEFPLLQSPLQWSFFKNLLTPGYHIDYYPLRDLSYWIDAHLWGLSTTAFRIHSLVIFFLTSFLVVFILRLLKLSRELTLLCVSFWMLSPLHLEAVLWISARKDLLAVLFLMLSFLSVLKYLMRPGQLYLVLSLLFYVLSLLSKATFVLFPAASLCCLVFLKYSKDTHWKKVRELVLPLFLMSLLGLSWALFQSWFYSNVNNMTLSYSLYYRFFAALAASGRYLVGSVWPDVNALDVENWGAWLDLNLQFVWVGVLSWLIVFLSGIFFFKKRNIVGLFVLAMALSVYLPTSGLVFPHRNFYSTRYYLPIFTLIVGGLALIFQHQKLIVQRILLFGVVWNTVSLIRSAPDWETSLAVRSHALEQSPQSTTLKVQLLGELKALSEGWKSIPEDLLNRLERIENEVTQMCEASMPDPDGGCLNFYRLQFEESLLEKNFQKSEQYISRMKFSLERAGLRRSVLLLYLRLSLHLKNASLEEKDFLDWKKRMRFYANPEYRVMDLALECLSGTDILGQAQRYRYWLESSLLNKTNMGEFISAIDPSYASILRTCIGLKY